MNRARTLTATLGTTAVLALSLTACGGGGGGAPADASTDDFCGAFMGINEIDPDASDADRVDAAQEAASELEEVGTPEDIPDDAREGFEIYVDAIGDIDEDDVANLQDVSDEEALESIGIDSEDADKVESFVTYTVKTCVGDLPTDLPTDELPTELPTDES